MILCVQQDKQRKENVMKKSFRAKHSESMFRSKIKKKYKNKLPTQIMTDPFVGRMYYNKNGRTVVYRNYRWEAL